MDREELFFDRLFPYLPLNETVIVGWLAIKYHLEQAGKEVPPHDFNDVDLIMSDLSHIEREVADELLVYHYHPNPTFPFLALVDPITKIKVDIFPHGASEEKSVPEKIGKWDVQIAGIEDQLIKTVLDCKGILRGEKINPKYIGSIDLLLQIANLDKANTIYETIDQIKKAAIQHPELLKEKMFRRDKPYICGECQSGNGFNVVPMEKVYEVLGYVE